MCDENFIKIGGKKYKTVGHRKPLKGELYLSDEYSVVKAGYDMLDEKNILEKIVWKPKKGDTVWYAHNYLGGFIATYFEWIDAKSHIEALEEGYILETQDEVYQLIKAFDKVAKEMKEKGYEQ